MRFILPTLLSLPILLFGEISYTVDFEGLDDAKALKALKSSSQLVSLQSKPPTSLSALRFRAESDIPDLVRVLHAYGYFEAQVKVNIQGQGDYAVEIDIVPGPLYTLAEYQIHVTLEGNAPCPKLRLKELGLCKGQPAISQDILDAQERALKLLSECGYPLAHILDRSVVADGETKTVRVNLTMQTGPLSHFGPHTIRGNTSVCEAFINQEICWCRGDIFNSGLVTETKQALIDTGLFCSAIITHGDQVDARGELPIDIELLENKHKSISIGASYQKTFGGGAMIGWENRNIGGMGRKLSLQADITQRAQLGNITYLIPNAWKYDQDLVFQAEAGHETITAYHDQFYQVQGRLDWQFCDPLFVSLAARGALLLVTDSVHNGNFLLFELPFKLRWSNVCDFLNPIKGMTFDWRVTPSVNVKDAADYYCAQQISFASYLPLVRRELFILAQKFTIGTIFSNGLGAIPVPRRLFGGSEENLRGYKYLTVSPLDEDDKPIGGRLAFFYSLEPRLRLGDFGLVPFFDLGNVGLNPWPPFKSKWRKSVGLGLRYFSFAGPLRLDVAFPLDRREHLDPTWWIFVSIGQAF